MTISEPKIRRRLDSWRFWVGIAYFGIAAVVLGLVVAFSRVSSEAAKRAATQQAANQARVTQCAVAVRNAPIVAGFVDGQRAIIRNSILATIGALANTARTDPLYRVRLASLSRLQEALSNTNQLAGLVSATTPTMASCDRVAAALRVPLPFPRKE